jgi:hypothetical protein
MISAEVQKGFQVFEGKKRGNAKDLLFQLPKDQYPMGLKANCQDIFFPISN